jgi:type IV secretory pathway TraG/TraD family ATPase VirD4
MFKHVTKYENNQKKTVGFKVSPNEYSVLQRHAEIFHNQMIQDPETKQLQRLLEKPKCVLCIHLYF